MAYSKLASAIKNDIVSGLRGYHTNWSLPMELIEDEIVNMRLQIIKEFQLKGIAPLNDLLLSINCIPIDCQNIERCPCSDFGTPTMHFEIPQIITDYGTAAIAYIGSVDRLNPFRFYTSVLSWNMYHKYRKRGKNKPFVYIDITPNQNNMFDCFVFNAPLLKQISVVGLFKDPRQLEDYGCCDELEKDSMSWINNEILNRIVLQKVKLYRLLAAPILPNDQKYAAG